MMGLARAGDICKLYPSFYYQSGGMVMLKGVGMALAFLSMTAGFGAAIVTIDLMHEAGVIFEDALAQATP